MRVLKIGPGPGVYTILLAQRVASPSEDGSVICLEIQPEMITMVRERLSVASIQNVEVVHGDGRQMSLPDGKLRSGLSRRRGRRNTGQVDVLS
jgi:ubiquinone/menaquinone biosynthesis C-methylase UbiE